MPISRTTRPKDIQLAIEHYHGQKIGYQAANNTLKTLRDRGIEQEREQFRQLTAYLELLHKADPVGCFEICINQVNSRFQRLFICPSASTEVYYSTPRFLACDGTFTKNSFRQTLLLATTIDGNNEIVVLAWALVESENGDSWAWFFEKLKG